MSTSLRLPALFLLLAALLPPPAQLGAAEEEAPATADAEAGDYILIVESIDDAQGLDERMRAVDTLIAELGEGPRVGVVTYDGITAIAYGYRGGTAWGVDPTTRRSKAAARLIKAEHPDVLWLRFR